MALQMTIPYEKHLSLEINDKNPPPQITRRHIQLHERLGWTKCDINKTQIRQSIYYLDQNSNWL